MTTNFKSELSKIMKLAWQMVKRNGFTMSEALKKAWANGLNPCDTCKFIVEG